MAGSRLQAGDVLAGYTVIRELGSGGMGTVYLVRHPRLPRNQALKVLASALGVDPAFRERFSREAHLAAQLDHPNIVAVADAGVDDDVMWIAMQFVDGTDAAALVRDNGPLPAAQAVDIITQAGAGLDYAHGHGMLHRDVKPANILVTPGWGDGVGQRVLISDFGIARSLIENTALTGTGTMIGTLAYAAPEMLTGAPLTSAVDVYALGCSMYELLTGQAVFPRPDTIAVMHAHATAPPPRVSAVRPDLTSEMDDVIARALAKQPEHRYPTCREFADAAATALRRPRSTATAIRPTPPPQRTPQPVRPMPTRPEQAGSGPTRVTHSFADGGAVAPGRPPTPPPPARRRGPGGVIIGAAVLAVVALIGVGVAVLFWRNSGTTTPTTGTVAATSTTTSTTATESATDTTETTSTSSSGTPALAGEWRGAATGDQTGFDVVATILTDNPVYGTVLYPQLSCAGAWVEQSRSGNVVQIAETVATGNCVESKVTLTADGADTLKFRSSYYSASKGRTMVITATLRRSS